VNKLLATSIVSIGLASAVPAVLAETAADPAGAPAGQIAQRHSEQRAFRAPSERAEAQLAYIRTALKITSAQQPQWDAYANVRRNQAAAMDKRFQERRAQMAQRQQQAGEFKRPTAIDRHERQRERMVQTSQRLTELLAVEKPLYAALSPEQQRVADEVLVQRGGRGGHGHGHSRGGFGRG